ncbi:MAG: MFS transporter [Pseudomonadota bacterium]
MSKEASAAPTHAWAPRALIGASVAIFWPGALAFGLPGVLAPHWQESFGAGRGQVGNCMFFLLAALGLCMYPAGRWLARWGATRLMSLGAVVAALDAVLLAYAPSLPYLYLWAFFNGVSQCCIYLPALATVQCWYPGRRGLVSGVVNLVFGLSAALMAPVFAGLLGRLGYQGLNLAIGGAAMLTMLAAAPFCQLPRAGQVPPLAAGGAGEGSLSPRQALASASFWRLWGTMALVGAGGIAMVTLSTAYGLALGLSFSQAVWILFAFNLGSGLSRLAMGFLSDLVPRTLVMAGAFAVAGLAYLGLPWVGGAWWPAMLAAWVGVAFGTLFAVGAPLAAEIFGPLHFGEVFGLLFTSYGFISGALGPSLAGYVLDMTGGNFLAVFSYLGVCCLLAAWLVRGVDGNSAAREIAGP